jgi:Spy/CpxP family protein refolding chaperone
MKAKSLLLTVLLASCAVALGAQSAPQPAPGPQSAPQVEPRRARPMMMAQEEFVAPRERLKEALALSDAQVASIEKLMSEQRKTAVRQRADQEIARMELEELMRADTLDEKAVDAKIRQVTELQAAALRSRVEQRVAMRKVLTPEQFQKWQQMRGRFGDRLMRQRMPRGNRPMRWRDDRGQRWRMPVPPGPPAAPRPPADPQDQPAG